MCPRSPRNVPAWPARMAGLLLALLSPLAWPTPFGDQEAALQAAYMASRIDLGGRVLDASGRPLAGVVVQAGQGQATTDAQGRYSLTDLPRRNVMLMLDAPGHHPEQRPVVLRRPLSMTAVQLPDVVLTPISLTRLAFGGDTSFARRYMDPQELAAPDEVPADDPAAIVRVSDPEPGARSVLEHVRPLFMAADFAVLNFESPVTSHPATPHPTKDFVYFSLPATLPALAWAGIDYVSLGNNHLYDYLEDGISDTLAHFAALGPPHSGAGPNLASALAPHLATVNGEQYSLLAMTSVRGSKHPIDYVASATKGGAADLVQWTQVEAAIATARATSRPIVQVHGGTEYAFAPTTFIDGALRRVARNQPLLVVGHHPHVAQGFGREAGVPIIHSLGNLAFDQVRVETMLSFVAMVDVDAAGVRAMRALPLYLEDFRPRPIGGHLAHLLLRRMAEFSSDGVQLYAGAGAGRVVLAENESEQVSATTIVDVDLGVDGESVVDLREHLPSRGWLVSATVEPPGALTMELGRDLMLHGDFEDWDVDDEQGEIARWLHGSSAGACLSAAHAGVQGLCSERSAASTQASVASFRNTVRVMGDATNTPIKDVSLVGWFAEDNAGPWQVEATYTTSIDGLTFGTELLLDEDGGSSDWQLRQVPLSIPDDSHTLGPDQLPPRGVRLRLRHFPPAAGDARLRIDELALVSWEGELAPDDHRTPHAYEFARLRGAPGSYRLTLHHAQMANALSDVVDADGVPSAVDNCPRLANPDQADLDGDASGDACDADIDGDGLANVAETDIHGTDPRNADSDADGFGDGQEIGLGGDPLQADCPRLVCSGTVLRIVVGAGLGR